MVHVQIVGGEGPRSRTHRKGRGRRGPHKTRKGGPGLLGNPHRRFGIRLRKVSHAGTGLHQNSMAPLQTRHNSPAWLEGRDGGRYGPLAGLPTPWHYDGRGKSTAPPRPMHSYVIIDISVTPRVWLESSMCGPSEKFLVLRHAAACCGTLRHAASRCGMPRHAAARSGIIAKWRKVLLPICKRSFVWMWPIKLNVRSTWQAEQSSDKENSNATQRRKIVFFGCTQVQLVQPCVHVCQVDVPIPQQNVPI